MFWNYSTHKVSDVTINDNGVFITFSTSDSSEFNQVIINIEPYEVLADDFKELLEGQIKSIFNLGRVTFVPFVK